jgi:hypothetical protein
MGLVFEHTVSDLQRRTVPLEPHTHIQSIFALAILKMKSLELLAQTGLEPQYSYLSLPNNSGNRGEPPIPRFFLIIYLLHVSISDRERLTFPITIYRYTYVGIYMYTH